MLVALLCATAAAANQTLTDPVSFKIDVHVGLLGLAADGSWEVDLSAAELHGLLTRALPSRVPVCGPTGTAADVAYSFNYNVVQMRTGLVGLHKAIASALRPAPGGRDAQYEVAIADVADHFDRIYSSYFDSGGPPGRSYTVLVVNPNRADMQRLAAELRQTSLPSAYRYHYVDRRAGVPTQMWVSRGRYLVLDLSAGPCTLGMTGVSPGAVSTLSVPNVHAGLQGSDAAKAARTNDAAAAASYDAEHTRLLARLTTVLGSAVRHVIAPDLRSCALPDFTETLIVPLVVLRDHRRFDPLERGGAHSIDVARLEEQVRRMLLPGQELRLLTSTHDLHSHPQVSVALARAQQSDTDHHEVEAGNYLPSARSYLDTAALTRQLRHSVDWLTSGLLDRAALDRGGRQPAPFDSADQHPAYHLHHAWSSRGAPRAAPADGATAKPNPPQARSAPIHRSRVLPVFVFSLLGLHEHVLLDGTSLVYTVPDPDPDPTPNPGMCSLTAPALSMPPPTSSLRCRRMRPLCWCPFSRAAGSSPCRLATRRRVSSPASPRRSAASSRRSSRGACAAYPPATFSGRSAPIMNPGPHLNPDPHLSAHPRPHPGRSASTRTVHSHAPPSCRR